jgi:hypothetical protein
MERTAPIEHASQAVTADHGARLAKRPIGPNVTFCRLRGFLKITP